MSDEKLSIESIIGVLVDLSKQTSQIHKEQSATGKVDPRVLIVKRHLEPLVHNQAISGNIPTEERTSNIGQVVKKAGQPGVLLKKPTTPSIIGQVTKPASTENGAEVLTAKKDVALEADKEFLDELKALTVDKLKSTKFSKDALAQIVKKINSVHGKSIEVTEEDTKATLSEKIYAALHEEQPKAEEQPAEPTTEEQPAQ